MPSVARAARRCGALAALNRWKLPPPVGLPRRAPAGSIVTPKGNFALARMFERLPVVVQIMPARPSRKSRGVVPHSTRPGGVAFRSISASQYCRAAREAGLS